MTVATSPMDSFCAQQNYARSSSRSLDSCSTLHISAGSLGFATSEESVSNFDDDARPTALISLCQDWFDEQNHSLPEDFEQLLARLCVDLERHPDEMSMSSIQTDDFEGHDSIVVTKRRRESVLNMPSESSEEHDGDEDRSD